MTNASNQNEVLLWPPPPSAADEAGGNEHHQKEVANTMDLFAVIHAPGGDDDEVRVAPGGLLEIHPSKVIFNSSTLYPSCTRKVQKRIVSDLQQCYARTSGGRELAVKEWADENQNRGILRLRLRCKKAKCRLQFQVNWETQQKHWFITRQCQNLVHTCPLPKAKQGLSASSAANVKTNTTASSAGGAPNNKTSNAQSNELTESHNKVQTPADNDSGKQNGYHEAPLETSGFHGAPETQAYHAEAPQSNPPYHVGPSPETNHPYQAFNGSNAMQDAQGSLVSNSDDNQSDFACAPPAPSSAEISHGNFMSSHPTTNMHSMPPEVVIPEVVHPPPVPVVVTDVDRAEAELLATDFREWAPPELVAHIAHNHPGQEIKPQIHQTPAHSMTLSHPGVPNNGALPEQPQSSTMYDPSGLVHHSDYSGMHNNNESMPPPMQSLSFHQEIHHSIQPPPLPPPAPMNISSSIGNDQPAANMQVPRTIHTSTEQQDNHTHHMAGPPSPMSPARFQSSEFDVAEAAGMSIGANSAAMSIEQSHNHAEEEKRCNPALYSHAEADAMSVLSESESNMLTLGSATSKYWMTHGIPGPNATFSRLPSDNYNSSIGSWNMDKTSIGRRQANHHSIPAPETMNRTSSNNNNASNSNNGFTISDLTMSSLTDSVRNILSIIGEGGNVPTVGGLMPTLGEMTMNSGIFSQIYNGSQQRRSEETIPELESTIHPAREPTPPEPPKQGILAADFYTPPPNISPTQTHTRAHSTS